MVAIVCKRVWAGLQRLGGSFEEKERESGNIRRDWADLDKGFQHLR